MVAPAFALGLEGKEEPPDQAGKRCLRRLRNHRQDRATSDNLRDRQVVGRLLAGFPGRPAHEVV